MNEIVVGVKRIGAGAILAESAEKAVAAVGCMWVTIDGREFPVDGTDGLIAVKLEASVSPLTFSALATKEQPGDRHVGGVLTVQATMSCSSFRTVDYRDPEYAPERFTERTDPPEAQ